MYIAPQTIYGNHKVPITGMCLAAIRSNVNQVADLNEHGRAGTAAMCFGSLTSGMVAEPQGVLLSNNLEVRKGICALVNWSRWSHISRADNPLLQIRVLRLAQVAAL